MSCWCIISVTDFSCDYDLAGFTVVQPKTPFFNWRNKGCPLARWRLPALIRLLEWHTGSSQAVSPGNLTLPPKRAQSHTHACIWRSILQHSCTYNKHCFWGVVHWSVSSYLIALCSSLMIIYDFQCSIALIVYILDLSEMLK